MWENNIFLNHHGHQGAVKLGQQYIKVFTIVFPNSPTCEVFSYSPGANQS